MRPLTIIPVCILLCCGSGQVFAADVPDSFGQILKPILKHLDVEGDPCTDVTSTGSLKLLDVVNLALCNNPQTRVAWSNARIQAAQVGVSRANYYPTNSISASESRNRVNASPSVFQRSLGLSLSYLLYDFGAREANVENARQLLEAVTATGDSTIQTVLYSAIQTYYQTHATRAAYQASLESERATKESFAAAQARYAAGSATPADKLQAQTAYSQATLNRLTAEGSMKIAQGTLANMLGMDANKTVSLIEANDVVFREEAALKILERNVAELIEEARQHRPDLYAAAAQVKAAQANVDAARAAGKPSISLSFSSNQSIYAGVASHGTSSGISLSAPIFAGFAPTYRVKAAQAQMDTQQAQFEHLRLQVALDVWTAFQNLATATQSLRSSADLLNSAQQSERVALGRYKAGVGNILDTLNAQSALASARQQRIQSTFNWNISRAALAQSMGNLDTELLQALPNSFSQPVTDRKQP